MVRVACILVLAFVSVSTETNPEEEAGLFEGDIELEPSTGFRSALKDQNRLWKDGIVPYKFGDRSVFDEEERANITAAMEEFHRHTCIRWVPRTNEERYIKIVNGRGCSSNVGMLRMSMIKIVQRIVLGYGCLAKGVIMHEMMHTVGFFHEQSRWDRDKYVSILPKNIKQGYLDQFRVHTLGDQNTQLGAPYDYGSLMHYRKDTFSEEGKDTIMPLKPGVKIGQRERFSELDIWKLNKVYDCPGYADATLPPSVFTTPAPVSQRPGYPMKTRDSFGCTFDQKWACDFHDELANDLDWKVRGGDASSRGHTGPSSGAHGEDCCYIHIHTVAHNPGEKALLVGPMLKPRTPSCLTFFYHMKGRSIGSLRVLIRDYRGNMGGVVFERSGQQSLNWQVANVVVEYQRPFQLVFEATVGDSVYTSYEGDIAIDSVIYRAIGNMRPYLRSCGGY